MVSFDHRDAGTTEEAWAAAAPWADRPCLVLDDVGRLVVLAAHPDDETLGAAGLICRVASRGLPVEVLVATDGEASHPHSPNHDPARLAAMRRDEVREAVDRVAPRAELTFLGIPDGGLREHRDDLRRALTTALTTALDGVTAEAALLVAPWAGDGHRDHRIAGEVARETAAASGVRLLEYPIWLWHWGTPGDTTVPRGRMLRLELTVDERAAKRRALDAHRSQTAPLSDAPGDEALLGAEMQRHFARDVEVFVQSGGSLGESFFDDFYDGKSDPWGFETRWYEERKRAITLASLPNERYASALEVGCSTGVLTERLAERCDRLLALDIADAPLERARARLHGHPQVALAKMATPGEWPQGEFDLIVLSEVGYYWDADDLDSALGKALHSLAQTGVLLACHWRHEVREYPLGGDVVHEHIGRLPELSRMVSHVEDDFVLEVFARPPAPSVARQGGLV